MDRLRSAVVVIAAVLGFLGLFLLGEAESSDRSLLGSPLQRVASARAPGVDAPRGCTVAEPGGLGALCALDAGPTHTRGLRGLRSGGATR